MDESTDSDMMNALMDAFQVAGVDAVLASRCACALVKQAKAKPSMMEFYGRGSLLHGANVTHKNLNVVGLGALDLRTCKPSGEPWDFPGLQTGNWRFGWSGCANPLGLSALPRVLPSAHGRG